MRGFNVIGPVRSRVGVGVHARYLLQLLQANGHPVAIYDFGSRDDGPGPDAQFAGPCVRSPSDLPYKINLFVFDIKTLCAFLANHPTFASRTDTLNTGVIMWELTVVPDIWKKALGYVDVLLCASNFIRATYDACLPETLTVDAPCPIVLPHGVAEARREFGLPADKVLFISCLDLGSSPERKNPFAAIDAFEEAFHGDKQAALVIKLTNNRPEAQDGQDELARLSKRVKGNPQIHVIDQALSYVRVLTLVASCDVYVSLHRSEGLGLGIMEAMLLGKPVIATAWSGNMSYMDHTNSCPVRYRLAKVRSSHPNFKVSLIGDEALWAEADVDHASALMQALARDGQLRSTLGERAAKAMDAYNTDASKARFVEELEAIWEYRQFLPRHKGAVDVDLRNLWWAARAQEPHLSGEISRLARTFFARHLQWRLRRLPVSKE